MHTVDEAVVIAKDILALLDTDIPFEDIKTYVVNGDGSIDLEVIVRNAPTKSTSVVHFDSEFSKLKKVYVERHPVLPEFTD